MGKKSAARLASIRASRLAEGNAQDEIAVLNQTLDNIKVLLSRETEKNALLQEEISNLKKQLSKSKTSAKKTSKKTVKAETIEE